MSWFRAYTDMIDDEKLRLLAFEDRWHFVALLCCKRAGLLDRGDAPDLLFRKLSVKLGLQLRELEAVAARLAEVGLIDEKTFQPLGWDSRQFESDSSSERSRACRARKKQAVTKEPRTATDVQRCTDVAATPPDTDTDTETEKESSLREHAETRCANFGPRSPHDAQQGEQISSKQERTTGQIEGARCPVSEIVDLYHQTLPTLPRCTKLTKARRGHIQARWREDLSALEDWAAYFGDVGRSDFLVGKVPGRDERPPFRATLAWLCKPENFARVREGDFHRKASPPPRQEGLAERAARRCREIWAQRDDLENSVVVAQDFPQ